MTFPQTQAYFVTMIEAASALNALGTPVTYSPFTAPESAKSAIAAALRAKGVCFEVGFPTMRSPESKLDGATQIDAIVKVFVAESLSIPHTPNLLSLINEVILACTAIRGLSTGQKPARLDEGESTFHEDGYILHILTFSIPLNIKPSSSVSSPQV
jgi:hypothetical protein